MKSAWAAIMALHRTWCWGRMTLENYNNEKRPSADAQIHGNRVDAIRTILVVAPSDAICERLSVLGSEIPFIVVTQVQTVAEACRPCVNPVALILIDCALLTEAEAASAALRRTHPAAQMALMHPSVSDNTRASESIYRSEIYPSLLPMDLAFEIWIAVIRLMLSGGDYFPLQLLGKNISYNFARDAFNADVKSAVNDHKQLTARELQILDKAAQGMQNKLIAAEFMLSEHTVKVHLHNIIRKLGVHNRTEAAAKFRRVSELSLKK